MAEFDIETFWNAEAKEHLLTATQTFEALQDNFSSVLDICHDSISKGGKLLFFGNGGSAADAQHLATELTVRYKENRDAIPAISLTTDTSALTAIGNDFGFDHLFSRQIEALGSENDVAIAISTSGQSPNVIKALEAAKEKGLKTIGLTGNDGGKMINLCDCTLIIPSNTTARIQEMHITLGQMLCDALEKKLGLV